MRSRGGFFVVGVVALPLVWTGIGGVSPARPSGDRGQIAELDIVASPEGSGQDCTYADPCSLQVAQEAVAARALAPVWHADLDVVLEPGTYTLTQPLRIGSRDSGRDGYQVVYRGADGDGVPVLSGGKQLTDWSPVKGTSIWSSPIPVGFDTRQLYVNGHRMPIATAKLGGVGLLQTSSGFVASSAHPIDSWVNPSNVQAVFRGGNGPWTQTSCPITSIRGTAMTLAEPCWHNLHLKALGVQELSWFDDPMGGFGGLAPYKAPTFFQNLYSALSPGRWVIDRVAHRIFYEPRKGEDLSKETVVVPALQTLLQVAGAHDVTVSGLTFSYGTWTAIDGRDGFPQMQADWYLSGPNANTLEGTCHYNKPAGSCPFASWTRTPANVVLTHTSHVSIVGNHFTHLGGAGLDLYRGADRDLVAGNEFNDIAASAIQLGATNDAYKPLEHHVTVTQNYIHEVANQYLGGIGIWLGYSTYSHITHNEIDHVPYTGISVGWGGWHQTVLAPNRNPNGNAHNLVANNVIYDYMHTLGDGGAIYTNGSQATSWATALRLLGNVAYRGTNTDFSMYTDAASRYVKVGGNLVYFQPTDSFDTGGCHTVGHIRVFNNYFAQGGPAYPCFLEKDIVPSNNTNICQDPTPAQLPVKIVRRAGLSAPYWGLSQQHRPEVDMVGPEQLRTSGGQVVVSGTGFTTDSVVRFGGAVASKVQFLSSNYLLVTAPAGHGKTAVTVTTLGGKSVANKYAVLTYSQLPTPCQLGSGTGISSGLLS